ncbi:LacI family transcriptional regulator [Aestuariivirga litoralis]|uniref:LacI family transcriptional regulator n=1 Tax=Aestuariivirga litoralis TaxID=2650924 RepID=A0A2W2AP59_9HYPH|nr:LacI family DNA-binding transcriptional regulator [Aestuariivirga litoralis]PZF75372.1 LacI family transcriptional regulator [Aestuariivirga litoralis]
MDRRPTIIDVAREAGVSKSTVSLVLQNSPSVRAETRAEVRAAMARLGYVYNRSAAMMRSSSAGLIGLVINDLRNPFFTEFATSLQMALSARGFATVIANTDESPDLQVQVISAMLEHGVSALIISPAYGDGDTAFEMIERAGVPAMQVLRKVNPRTERFPFAAPDYMAGGLLAARHLLAEGCRRIAFVGGMSDRGVTQERMAGYLSELDRAGLEPFALHGRATRAFGREAARQLLARQPRLDGAICFNDMVALGMMSGFAEAGHTVGSAFRIVGFDNIEEAAQAYPSLTSIGCGIADFGVRIAATVLGWLQDGTVPPPELRTPVELLVRRSSGLTQA